MKFVIAIIIFSIIILFHELGHFLLAKKNGIRVNEFSLGLGPTIIGVTKGETKYSLKLLPFGGACMMEGEDGESKDARAFPNKSVPARMSVIAAGPIFNFVMAFVFAFILIACVGYDKPVITDVSDNFPAKEAGMQGGDKIISMNGYKTHFYREISLYPYFHSGEKIRIVYERNKERFEVNLTPLYDEETGRYRLGVVGTGAREKGTVVETLQNSVYELKYWVYTTVQSLKMLITGKVGVKDLSGPVGIVRTIGDTYDESRNEGGYMVFLNMLNISILLSVNLGVMNLLPLPALDGGRLVFLVIEGIRKKRMDPGKEGMVHFVGLMLLMALMVFVMFNDIRKIF
ncbi:RIP metalloprotease RseP [Lachnospiraceae bacterium ZAX-1]